jgi:hypothetical protein
MLWQVGRADSFEPLAQRFAPFLRPCLRFCGHFLDRRRLAYRHRRQLAKLCGPSDRVKRFTPIW